MIADLLVTSALVLAGILTLLAGIGTWRLPNVRVRIHAAAKAGSAAFGLVLAAVVCHEPSVGVAVKAVLTLLCSMLTLPLAAQMLGRYAGPEDDEKATSQAEAMMAPKN